MITESDIDLVIEDFGDPGRIQEEIVRLTDEQGHLAAFLNVDNHSLLSKDEYSLLWFLIVVIYNAYEAQHQISLLSEEQIGDKEEKIWQSLNDSKEKTFRGKLDELFEMCPEEDLLAFLEDSLVADEDTVVTNAGREFVFVPAASLIFALSL